MNQRIEESDASWNRAQRIAKKLRAQGDEEGANRVIDNELNKETYRRAVVARNNAIKNPGVPAYLDYEAETAKRVQAIPRPPKKRMSQSVKEGLFNSYRNIANVLLEGDWNTRHLSPQERVDRAESDTQREAPFDKRGKKHVELRKKRLARRSALARAALAKSEKVDAMADNIDIAKDMSTGGSTY
jgi:hypothetical protein